jgi:hypothetical protein
LDDAVKYNPNLKDFYDLCERVSGYYLADRYPPLGTGELTCKDIEVDMREAIGFIPTMLPEENLSG